MLFTRIFSRNQLCKLYITKTQNFEVFHDWNPILKFHRPIYLKMVDNVLQPPSHVKGMKILDKDQFEKAITVPCLYLPHNSISKTQKPLKQYLLKLQNFRPLAIATQTFIHAINQNGINATIEDGKMAILDPRKVKSYRDITDSEQNILKIEGINENYFTFIEMFLKYENWKADEILRAIIPTEFDSVSGYSLVGHIVHLNLRDHLSDYKHIIGNVLLEKIKPARTVVNKVDIIDNTFRNFQMEILCGDNDMIVNVRENKSVFVFDFSQVYWNPRLCTEHERVTENLKKGDVVYDVFCGVGPFSIPAAKRGCLVLANDLNPFSVKWLNENIKLNKVEKNVQIFNKDGREFIREDLRNHMLSLDPSESCSIYVIMNLPALAPSFLSSFHNLFSENEMKTIELLSTPKVIVYCFVKGVCDPYDEAISIIGKEIGIELHKEDEEVQDIFFVRDVAPNKKMMRVTMKLTKKVLLNKKRQIEHFSEPDDSKEKKACL